MTLHTINSSLPTYAGKMSTNPQNVINKLDDFSDVESNFLPPPPPPASENNSSLVQSVLQSLQNLGLDALNVAADSAMIEALPEEASQALQAFVQNLHNALTLPANNPKPPIFNSDNTILESLDSAVTQISGGTNFKYTVDFSEAELGDYLPDVRANIKTALENIGQYVSSTVPFDVKVFTKTTDDRTLAEAVSTIITTTMNGEDSIDTSFVSDSMYGVELQPGLPDSKIYINLARLEEMSFKGLPDPEKFDFTSIVTHEILHGLAFTGALDSASPLRTGYDDLVTTIEGVEQPIFLGRHARTTNGGNPIPLSPETSGSGSSFYHVGIPSDLMAESIKKGEVKTISALDIAMLQDMGVAVTGVSPNLPQTKVQMAYGNTPPSPSDAVKNLMNSMQQQGELQINFDNLVNSLGSSDVSPDVNLQNFLTQLAANTQQLPQIQSTGSLFSVLA